MKPNLSKTEIQAFLKRKYHAEPALLPVREGQESQVYGFRQGGASYILRIHPSKEGFLKDQYAYVHFGALVPIPEIFEIGRFQKSHFYCISRKEGGITYEDGDAVHGKNRGVLESGVLQVAGISCAHYLLRPAHRAAGAA